MFGMPLTGFAAPVFDVQRAADVDFSLVEGERQTRVLKAFEGAAGQSSVPYRSDVRTGSSAEEFVTRAHCADLVVMPRGESDRGRVGSDVEAMVRAVPHPFLIASEKIDTISCIAVAFDGSPGSIQALAAAADIAQHWKSKRPEILLIEIVPPDETANAALTEAGAYLDLYELPYRTVRAHGVPGEEIPAVAEREEVDLLCMGAYGHWVVRDFLLGSTTQAVIERRRKPILLCH